MHRRSFLTGLAGLIAAPAIARASSLMPVRGIVMEIEFGEIVEYVLNEDRSFADFTMFVHPSRLAMLQAQINRQSPPSFLIVKQKLIPCGDSPF